MTKKKNKFEDELKRLEEIVELLENPDTELDDSIKFYSEGIKLFKNCQDILSSAEQEIVKLSKNKENELVEKKFGENLEI